MADAVADGGKVSMLGEEGWKGCLVCIIYSRISPHAFQTMAAKRNATGLASAMPRASLNDEELVSRPR